MASRFQTWILLALLGAAMIVPLFGARHLNDLAAQMMIYSLFALSLNLLCGQVGSVSFGHAAFFAIGGYAVGYLQKNLGLPLPVSMAASVVFTALCSLVIGYFCVRLNQIYFSILTLAFSMLVWAVAKKWTGVTGGTDGLVGVPLPELIARPSSFYWFVVAVTAVSTAILWKLSNSTFGRALIAIRESPKRAAFLGINVRRMRLYAFVIAGTFAGVAGQLLTLQLRSIFPESAFWSQSGEALIMVILGGIHSFVGPVIGSAVLYLLRSSLSQNYTQEWELILGVILLAVVLLAPQGIYGLLSDLGERLRWRTNRDA